MFRASFQGCQTGGLWRVNMALRGLKRVVPRLRQDQPIIVAGLSAVGLKARLALQQPQLLRLAKRPLGRRAAHPTLGARRRVSRPSQVVGVDPLHQRRQIETL